MKRALRLTLKILLALFLALTALSLLLIPHRHTMLTDGLSPAKVAALGSVAWLASLWLRASVLLNYSHVKERYVLTAAGGLCVLFAVFYARAGSIIESSILFGFTVWIILALLWAAKEEPPPRHTNAIFLALANLVLGIVLIAIPRLLPISAYIPLLDWQVELGGMFFLTGLYALPALLRNRSSASFLYRHLLALPWLGYVLVFLFANRIPNAIPALIMASTLAVADYFPREQIILPANDNPGRRIFLLIVGAETFLLLTLVVLLSFTHHAAGEFGSREIAFIFFLLLTTIGHYGTVLGNIMVNTMAKHLAESEADPGNGQNNLESGEAGVYVSDFMKPFSTYRYKTRSNQKILEQQIQSLENQRNFEKRRINQLLLLNELSRQLESQLDQPVAAQLAVNALERALNCALAVVLLHEAERREFSILAVAGSRLNTIPPGYRQGIQSGVLGRTARQRKTQVIQDTRLDPDYIRLEEQHFLSEVCVPLIHHGHLKGMLVVDGEQSAAFSNTDVDMIESVGAELIRAWERSGYRQRLTDLIQAGISLSTLLDPQTAIEEIAAVSRRTLEARFTFVTLLDQDGKFSRTAQSGAAPELLAGLMADPANNAFIQTALNASQAFRVRDVRKYRNAEHLRLDNLNLRSLLAIPIHLHRLSIGVILVFGKQGELFFSENDESLAGLLSSQAAAAIESAWLYHELRNTLGTTTLLYQLSSSVIQAEELDRAAGIVAETAFRLANASEAGIVLFTPDDHIEARLLVNSSGSHHTSKHPSELVSQVRQTGQSIFISPDQETARVCYPLQTPSRNYGALWLEIPESRKFTTRSSSNLQALANQAAVALERAILLVESRQQARELEGAYREMENTYDRTLAALTSALDARDRETQGHSLRVGKIASRLGQAMGLSEQKIKALERGAILHDIGKIGIADTILHKPGPLNEEEWATMRMHPDIGARIVEGIPFLDESLPVIRYHQERWDGSGYPVGLRKTDIPALARIFAVADAFDALTSTRPYRKKSSTQEALAYLHEQAGILFDPKIVTTFERLIQEGEFQDLMV